jgi:hypothetical protein
MGAVSARGDTTRVVVVVRLPTSARRFKLHRSGTGDSGNCGQRSLYLTRLRWISRAPKSDFVVAA